MLDRFLKEFLMLFVYSCTACWFVIIVISVEIVTIFQARRRTNQFTSLAICLLVSIFLVDIILKHKYIIWVWVFIIRVINDILHYPKVRSNQGIRKIYSNKANAYVFYAREWKYIICYKQMTAEEINIAPISRLCHRVRSTSHIAPNNHSTYLQGMCNRIMFWHLWCWTVPHRYLHKTHKSPEPKWRGLRVGIQFSLWMKLWIKGNGCDVVCDLHYDMLK